ncbi:MAG: ATP-binding protein [Lachnospiraceae bacterium]|nr:ATP-binding protein [Lachnospiraceae bacterium]
MLYNTSGFNMAVIYGRRRIGKSTLIAEFIKDKKAIYYMATKVGIERNVELLEKEVLKVLAPTLKNVTFKTIEDLLSFIGDNASEEKMIFIIDELPYWAEKDEGILSIFQKFADNEWADKNILFILCGSALSFMEDKVLSEKSPLFGRRTAQIKLEAFNYLEAAEFVQNYSNKDKAICYGITGGVAKYLSLIDCTKSIDENIMEQFFEKTGYLYDETRNLLIQEFSDISLVNNIIEQIAAGENTLNIIANKVHERETTVLYSLNKLISVGLLEKRVCITEEKNKKKTQYILKDQMFKFWYSYVPSASSSIEMGKGKAYYDKIVKPDIHTFMGKVFEEMCKFFTLSEGLEGNLNCFVTETGTWWGTETIEDENGKRRIQSADVDVVGLSPSDKGMVVGECKFRNEKIDKSIYETLIRRSKAIPSKYPIVQYLLFSMGGFTEWFEDNIDKKIVALYTLDDLYEI